MNIVITGAGGQLAHSLHQVLTAEGHTLHMLKKQDLDVTDADRTWESIRSSAPDAVIHCAAMTHVDMAEKDPGSAYRVNAMGTRNVAGAAAASGAAMVYISTDYVFDGKKGAPYIESDIPCPLNVYGASKYFGEKFVELLCPRRFILRTAWLYGAGGKNFVNSVIEMALKGGPLRVAEDQVGSPTSTKDLACFIAALLQTDHYGLYHAANQGACTREEWVAAILHAAGLPSTPMIKQSLVEFRFAAPRPLNTALDDRNIRSHHLPRFRGWLAALEDYIASECKHLKLRKE